ncbi:MAG: hypothetical protein GX295_04855 [Syntrophomonadaceae bacterium]|nr:hypothetical protein [Syntrophomonadaceae bacterium]
MTAKERVRLTAEDLKVNQLVEIEVVEGSFTGHYPSRIEEIGEDTLTLAMPLRKGEIVPLRPGDRIKVSFTRDEAGYLFHTRILSRVRTPLPIMIVEKREEAERWQRRSWVRVEITLPIHFRPWKAVRGNDEAEEVPYIEAETIDLSGGGILFTTNEKLQEGDYLDLLIDLPEIGPFKMKVRISRIQPAPPTAKKSYMVGVEFLNMREAKRDRIVKVVFDRQRELIQRGVLG